MPKQNPLLNIVKKQKEGKAVAREFDTPFHN